jgi:hypothetical protein
MPSAFGTSGAPVVTPDGHLVGIVSRVSLAPGTQAGTNARITPSGGGFSVPDLADHGESPCATRSGGGVTAGFRTRPGARAGADDAATGRPIGDSLR